MGIRLVGLALRPDWAVLSDRARVVLVSMCMVALDTPSGGKEAGLYYKGHRALMTDIYGTDWKALDAKQKEAAEKVVKRAIRELKEAGAITLVSSASYGKVAEYRIHPDRFPGLDPVDNSIVTPVDGVHHVYPNGVRPVYPKSGPRGTPSVRDGVRPVYPQGEHSGEGKGEDKFRTQLNHLLNCGPSRFPTCG